MNRPFSFAIAITMAAVLAHDATAQSASNSAATPATAAMSGAPADNTEANRLDSSSGMPTADSQRENAADMALSQRIRKQVMADKSLSTYAHNVKIISVNGMVTLNGVVRTEHDKDAIETKAQSIAGKSRVVNDLTVAPST